jgi:hypothetical protein
MLQLAPEKYSALTMAWDVVDFALIRDLEAKLGAEALRELAGLRRRVVTFYSWETRE